MFNLLSLFKRVVADVAITTRTIRMLSEMHAFHSDTLAALEACIDDLVEEARQHRDIRDALEDIIGRLDTGEALAQETHAALARDMAADIDTAKKAVFQLGMIDTPASMPEATRPPSTVALIKADRTKVDPAQAVAVLGPMRADIDFLTGARLDVSVQDGPAVNTDGGTTDIPLPQVSELSRATLNPDGTTTIETVSLPDAMSAPFANLTPRADIQTIGVGQGLLQTDPSNLQTDPRNLQS